MNIALDAMGGDFAPKAIIEGAVKAKNEGLGDDVSIILVGDEQKILSVLANLSEQNSFKIVHAADVVEMGENPTKAVVQKPESSIMVGYQLLKNKEIDAFCGCGNTGAMLVGSMFTIKAIEGVIRPGIAGFIPKDRGVYGTLLDIGANADCKPDVLVQFAEMGYLYHKHVFKVDNPTVGLMSLGREETKGSLLTEAAFQMLKYNKNINFIGNVEGRDVLTDEVDVIVCDGFTGNIILKLCESMYPLMDKRGFHDEFIELFNHSNVGGSPILGVNGNVIIGHGDSSPNAVKNMLNLAVQTVQSDIAALIKSAYQ